LSSRAFTIGAQPHRTPRNHKERPCTSIWRTPRRAIEAARKKAIALNTQMCIAVVDSGANLKAFMRMDDAWVGSIDIAIKKAKTACFFGMATGLLGQLSQPGKPL
jgi:uncharacterized protein GlcG (DUF336 family)